MEKRQVELAEYASFKPPHRPSQKDANSTPPVDSTPKFR